uniref:Uncharacterized protein n=1 Tax=Knipowitschia caucasica TaxID=637954 RepID=A0AAV2MJW6_KNICA
METARLSSPPPLHFHSRPNSYSRKRVKRQQTCPGVAAVLWLSRSLFAPPPGLLWTSPPLLVARSLVCALSVPFLSFRFLRVLDLSMSAHTVDRARWYGACVDDRRSERIRRREPTSNCSVS